MRQRSGIAGAICALSLVMAACATRAPAPLPTVGTRPAPVTLAPVPSAALSEARAVRDPVAELIARSTDHFEQARQELDEGHLETAKTEFNRALEVILESPDGARADPRLREHFDRLVERISAFEVTALAQGDGFTAPGADPASIDELLAISTFAELEATARITEAVTEDLQVTVHDIDIPLNPRVLSSVELFSGRLKSYLEEGMNRGAPYLPMIQRVFKEEGIPLDLAYVPLVESAFKVTALSRARARGMWQFMQGTARENGLKQDWYIDERSDPEKATRAAAKYLKTLYNMFGDWHLALASYNGGPGRVQRAIRRSGQKDFWRLTRTSTYLPRETRNYVPLILAAVIIARNPGQYGMEVQAPYDPVVERVPLSSPIDLRRVAEWVGTPVQTIQELNPELRRWITPLQATDYELKVPEGTSEIVRARLSEMDPAELAPLNRHTVRKDETLTSIARKLNVSRTDLAEANYLRPTARLTQGQQLIIPRAPTLLLSATTGNAAPSNGNGFVAGPVVAPGDLVPALDTQEPTTVVHRVRSGDTLSSIARRYQTSVASVKQWNRLTGDTIRVGQRLTIQQAHDFASD